MRYKKKSLYKFHVFDSTQQAKEHFQRSNFRSQAVSVQDNAVRPMCVRYHIQCSIFVTLLGYKEYHPYFGLGIRANVFVLFMYLAGSFVIQILITKRCMSKTENRPIKVKF